MLTMAGGLGGVVVAGAAVGWDLSRPGAKTASTRTGTSGIQRDTAVTRARTPAGKVIWTTGTGSVQLAVGADVVVMATGPSKVIAMDIATGAHRWTWSGFSVEMVQAQGDTVIVTAWDGPFRIIGIDASSGRQLWTNDTGSETPRMAIASGLAVAPAAGNIGAVSAYEISSGTVPWTFRFPGHPTKWPAYIAAVDGDFYVADSTDLVWHVSASGAMLAQFTAPAGNPYPLVVTDGVLCGLGNGLLYEGPQRLYALDAANGTKLWDSPLSSQAGNSVVAADGTVFVAGSTADNGLSAIMTWNARSGAPGWHHDWPGSTAANAPLATAPGSLLIGIRQTLCAFNAATGDSQWQITLDGDITTIVVSGTVAYVSTLIRIGTGSSRLYAIQL
jgi:outer membrane protein assembly factor BamB